MTEPPRCLKQVSFLSPILQVRKWSLTRVRRLPGSHLADSRSERFCAPSHPFLWTLPVSLSYRCLVFSSPGAGSWSSNRFVMSLDRSSVRGRVQTGPPTPTGTEDGETQRGAKAEPVQPVSRSRGPACQPVLPTRQSVSQPACQSMSVNPIAVLSADPVSPSAGSRVHSGFPLSPSAVVDCLAGRQGGHPGVLVPSVPCAGPAQGEGG
ncbi:uncharacterized protein LOC111092650 isoform X1 [Canis lupus familiaris]|uniref:uncharacterized protein LOC111092650 isoform X1 n=1 Tax=Canis lupus familiaris TaxID=9615 RepID=UPI000BAA328E|nr:uncharacterized protein LOC111092650 isoform X1 [Canis lupus familiaris]|eukprot:XP_022266374.1 uncharacterized protein LOC111092650 [Canis lupus familiaris]